MSLLKIDKKTLLGTMITLVGSFLYVIFGLLSKFSQQHISFNYLIFLQSVTGLGAATLFLYFNQFQWSLLRKDFHLIYGLRIIISLASMYAFIYGLQFVSVYNALVILNFCPFFMPVLRLVFFKRKIQKNIYAAITLAFIGITLILSPDSNIFYSSTLIIVASMLCMAFSILLLEHKSGSNVYLSIFYYFLFSTVITGCAVVISPNVQAVAWSHIGLGLLTGILFFLVQLSMIYAARYISTQLISMLFYFEVVYALIISLFLDDMQLSSTLLIGTMLILLGGFSMLYFENKIANET